jgi:hypothetical protein
MKNISSDCLRLSASTKGGAIESQKSSHRRLGNTRGLPALQVAYHRRAFYKNYGIDLEIVLIARNRVEQVVDLVSQKHAHKDLRPIR